MKEYLTYNDVNIVPRYSEISSRSNVDISTELCGHNLDIPVIASPMESVMGANMQATLDNNGATGVFHRFGTTDDVFTPVEGASKAGHNPVIVSIGVDGEVDYDMKFYDKHANVILIDVAHGHHKKVKLTLKWLNREYPNMPAIAGNVATPKAAIDLIKWGADAIRVGVGGGSVCTTRMKTGVGVPMISCIEQIYKEVETRNRELHQVRDNEIKIIADGGMKTPGDIAKALAAGADGVMLGSMLAGSDEAPGEIIEVDGQKMKKYYGSASREQKGNNNYVEGVSQLIPHKGSVVDVLDDIKDGLRSAFSYVGASNLEEFHDNAELIQVTNNGYREGTAHI